MKQLYKNLLLWSVILVMFVALYQFFNSRAGAPSTLCYSDLVSSAQAGKVSDITIDGQNYLGHLIGGAAFHVVGRREPPDELLTALTRHGARVRFEPEPPDWSRIYEGAMVTILAVGVVVVLGLLVRKP